MSLNSSTSGDSERNLYVKMKAFLDAFGLTALEAQIIIEVCNSREYYIDTRKLLRKLPKVFRPSAPDLERLLKDLIQRRFLAPYESKKDKFCVRSAEFGRDFFRQAVSVEAFSSLEDFPALQEEYGRGKLMCYDPAGFKKGEIRQAVGPNGEKISVEIVDILPADEIWSDSDDDRTVFAIRLIGDATCPRCSNLIRVDFSYTPSTCYSSFNEFTCNRCSFKFMLGCSLLHYY